jgi:hypothetical protein
MTYDMDQWSKLSELIECLINVDMWLVAWHKSWWSELIECW